MPRFTKWPFCTYLFLFEKSRLIIGVCPYEYFFAPFLQLSLQISEQSFSYL